MATGTFQAEHPVAHERTSLPDELGGPLSGSLFLVFSASVSIGVDTNKRTVAQFCRHIQLESPAQSSDYQKIVSQAFWTILGINILAMLSKQGIFHLTITIICGRIYGIKQ